MEDDRSMSRVLEGEEEVTPKTRVFVLHAIIEHTKAPCIGKDTLIFWINLMFRGLK